jgi:hypothetical protein
MFIKSCKLYPFTLIGVAMIVTTCLAVPICYAGGAVTLVPAENRMAPEGSYISEHRKNKIEKEVQEYKAAMKQESEKQQQDQSLKKGETQKSEDPEEK